jgi:hypothetical protein
MAWLKEMREMRRDAQHERELQTQAFVAALDKLGGRIDGSMSTMRAEMRRHLNVLVLTFALSFLVLGGLAGIGIYLRAFGITAQTSALAPTASAP